MSTRKISLILLVLFISHTIFAAFKNNGLITQSGIYGINSPKKRMTVGTSLYKKLMTAVWGDGSSEAIDFGINFIENAYWYARYKKCNRLNTSFLKRKNAFFKMLQRDQKILFNKFVKDLQSDKSEAFNFIFDFNKKYSEKFPQKGSLLKSVMRLRFSNRGFFIDYYVEKEDALYTNCMRIYHNTKKGRYSLILGTSTVLVVSTIVLMNNSFFSELGRDLYGKIKNSIINRREFNAQKRLSKLALEQAPDLKDLCDGFNDDLNKKINSLLADVDVKDSTPSGFVAKVQLDGDPGTGKTVLSQALAKYWGAIYHEYPGSFFVEKFMNASSSKIRDTINMIIKDLKKSGSDPMVVFFDEIDSIARKRSVRDSSGAADDTKTLLAYTNGINSLERAAKAAKKKLIIISATNLPDSIDPAADRRKEYRFEMLRPTYSEVQKVFEKELGKKSARKKISDEDLVKLASEADGISYGHIHTLVKEIIQSSSSDSGVVLKSALEKLKELQRSDKDSIVSTKIDDADSDSENKKLKATIKLPSLFRQHPEQQLNSLKKLVEKVSDKKSYKDVVVDDADKENFEKWKAGIDRYIDHLNVEDMSTTQTFMEIKKTLSNLNL